MEELTTKQQKDVRILVRFIELFCKAKHHEGCGTVRIPGIDGEAKLCKDCEGLISYAVMKRKKCPLDPKPSCKHCHIHCYSKEYREKIREVMAFSGRKMLMRGRLDMLWHYFF